MSDIGGILFDTTYRGGYNCCINNNFLIKMITLEELKDPEIFSNFVEKLEKGETTPEEDEIFEKALDSMDADLREIAEKVINSKKE